jgi:uncharacterized heparinase superfamily protein
LKYLSGADFKELVNYIRWRMKQDPVAFLKIPFEWTAVIHSHFRRKSDGRDLNAAWDLADPAAAPFHLFAPNRLKEFALITDSTARIDEANNIVSGRVRLPTGIEVCLDPPSWTLEADDHEDYLWLHRWSYGQTLAQAWVYTGDRKYSDFWLELWSDWVQNNPASKDSPQWESYSVAERIVNWCVSLSLMQKASAFDVSAVNRVRESLIQHARWLSSYLESKDAHNHLINNARALFLFSGTWSHRPLESAAWSILESELERQVLCDGMLGEQSVHYHLLLTRTYFETVLVARLLKREIPSTFLARVEKMVSVALAFLRPDGSIPAVGDLSPDIDTTSLSAIIAAAARYFDIDQTKGSTCLPDSGFWILRTDRLHLVTHADPRSEVIRHGHDDALSIALWVDGNEILIDSGNATYTPGPLQDFFRGASAHNTLTIDEYPISPTNERLKLFLRKDYFRRPVKMFPPQINQFWSWTRIEHRAYSRLKRPIAISRLITATADYVWVSDRVQGDGRHRLHATWHFASPEVQRQFGSIWLVDGLPASAHITKGWRSPEYGRKQASATAATSLQFESTCTLDFLVWFGRTPLQRFSIDKGRVSICTTEWTDHFESDSRSSNLIGQRISAS